MEKLPLLKGYAVFIKISVALMQLGYFFWLLFSFESSSGGGSPMAALAGMVILPGYLLITIPGLILILLSGQFKQFGSLLLFSGLILVGVLFVETISPVMRPVVTVVGRMKDQQLKKEYARTKHNHYALLEEQFRSPQKVVGVKRNYVLLSDHKVIKLGWGKQEDIQALEKFFAENIIGNKVTVKTVPFDEFIESYLPGSVDGSTLELRKALTHEEELALPMRAEIPGDIVFKGESLNKKFSLKHGW